MPPPEDGVRTASFGDPLLVDDMGTARFGAAVLSILCALQFHEAPELIVVYALCHARGWEFQFVREEERISLKPVGRSEPPAPGPIAPAKYLPTRAIALTGQED